MSFSSEPGTDEAEGQSGLVTLGALSLLVGAVAGLVTAVFRLALDHADSFRDALIAWAHGWHFAGFLFVIATCAAAVAVAAWLVRRYSPYASGSGIPHVEAVLKGDLRQVPYRLIWVKFCGGLLAIGSGLALGREGPSVQMGASLANLLGEVFRRNENDCRALLAAGAGAGLATAFNAPIGGAVFVLEELTRRFDTRITIATLGASAGAIAVARVLLGDTPDFLVEPIPYPSFGTLPIYLTLGIIAGCLGVAYNRAILATLAVAERLREWPVEARAAVVGAAVGLLAWFVPAVVGGGDALTQRTLAGAETVATVSVVFLVRFALGPLSYAAGTPGGLFAPILVLGAQSGFLFANVSYPWVPAITPTSTALAVVGMAAFFTAVVRAPLTGIILVIEMTASFTLFLPMLGACFAAMLVPIVLRNAPIYDSLRERTLKGNRMASVA
ncbi:MAG TPA: H(+)/Cl(-) exchange transporter ClcA [Pseudolabrys sp.]